MSEKAAPPIPPPGRIFELFKPPGSKKFSANIVLPNGIHQEVFETDATERLSAGGITNGRVRELYKQYRIETPTEYRRRTGSQLSLSAIRQALAQGKVPDESAARNKSPQLELNGSPEEEVPEREPEQAPQRNWPYNLGRIETKLAMGYNRILAMVLLRQDEDPIEFREHVRAIVTEITLSGLTPTGMLQKKRGPYKPREG